MTGPLKSEIERLRMFYRQVVAAAGDLNGLPDGHALEIVGDFNRNDEKSVGDDPEEDDSLQAIFTVGMIRKVYDK